jgi:tRNA dimethylallyltransferase
VSHNPFHNALYLTGPTASGKTRVGVLLAQRLNAEIIALDSMTLYRGMDIATAKPTLAERRGIAHHLIDVIDPWDSASVATYRAWALEAATDIELRNRRVLFVGGTPLYLKALLRGLFEGPGADPTLRAELERQAEERGNAELHAQLARVDPVTAARLFPHDRRRVIRALEVFELTGQPLSHHQQQHDQPAPDTVRVFALDPPRAYLHERINRRVLQFFDDGLVDEVRRLLSDPRSIGSIAVQGIGYAETRELLAGRMSHSQTVERIQSRTRQFAKRQCTWFRNLREVQPFPIAPDEDPQSIAERVLQAIEAHAMSLE